jgi:hypothetical protein
MKAEQVFDPVKKTFTLQPTKSNGDGRKRIQKANKSISFEKLLTVFLNRRMNAEE